MNREVYEIERREEGSLLHVKGKCIEKALSWGDERLMRTFVWSLNLFNGLCVYLVMLGLVNNIKDIIGYMWYSSKYTTEVIREVMGSQWGASFFLSGDILCLILLERLKMKRIASF